MTSLPDLSSIPRVRLGAFPTPMQEMPRLSQLLGRNVLIKRDDLSGLALGGNKARKLEFLIGDAHTRGCDTVIATGFLQSNNVVQTAAASTRHGMHCIVVLEGERPKDLRGNLVLSLYLGADIRYAGTRRPSDVVNEVVEEVSSQGGAPYPTPPGGSSGIGVLGFVVAMAEARRQLAQLGQEIDAIVVPTGTGGTQAGMVLGAKLLGWQVPVIGVSTGKSQRELRDAIPAMAAECARVFHSREQIKPSELIVYEEFFGAGYALPCSPDFDAIRTVARTEGIFTDPVYTGRAMHGMFEILRRGEIPGDRPILFWHTGGLAALFAIDEVDGSRDAWFKRAGRAGAPQGPT